MADAPSGTEATSATKKSSNSYYYWHGHEKERAKVGDVAPLPTPVLVKREEGVASPVVAQAPVVVPKYSWCDNDKSVSVYVDIIQDADEVLNEDSLAVEIKKTTLKVTFTTKLVSGVEKRKQLYVLLAKRVDPTSSTFKVKPSNMQVYVKLAKPSDEKWYDLAGKTALNSESDEDAAVEDQDSD